MAAKILKCKDLTTDVELMGNVNTEAIGTTETISESLRK